MKYQFSRRIRTPWTPLLRTLNPQVSGSNPEGRTQTPRGALGGLDPLSRASWDRETGSRSKVPRSLDSIYRPKVVPPFKWMT
jgi:hypothetical protein